MHTRFYAPLCLMLLVACANNSVREVHSDGGSSECSYAVFAFAEKTIVEVVVHYQGPQGQEKASALVNNDETVLVNGQCNSGLTVNPTVGPLIGSIRKIEVLEDGELTGMFPGELPPGTYCSTSLVEWMPCLRTEVW